MRSKSAERGVGALGFCTALREVFAPIREQRCSVHKTMNVLNTLPKSKLAEAIRCALGRMPKARAYLENGRVELDNNICERSIRPVTLRRENYLFMGSKAGGQAAAIAYTLMETARRLTTKIHALVNEMGLPIRIELTLGQAHDAPICKLLLNR